MISVNLPLNKIKYKPSEKSSQIDHGWGLLHSCLHCHSDSHIHLWEYYFKCWAILIFVDFVDNMPWKILRKGQVLIAREHMWKTLVEVRLLDVTWPIPGSCRHLRVIQYMEDLSFSLWLICFWWLKCIINLNTRSKTIKLLKENIRHWHGQWYSGQETQDRQDMQTYINGIIPYKESALEREHNNFGIGQTSKARHLL